jgi:plasmid stabilization system protein ParE
VRTHGSISSWVGENMGTLMVFDKEIRQLIIGKYRVLFTVELNHVHILHVRHGAQLWLFPKPE